jgi:hypothetical protein
MAVHSILRTRMSAVAVCAIALTLTFGAGAVAASKITSADIKDHTIQTKDLKSGSVTTKVLHKNAVKSKKIKAGAVHSGDIKDGDVQSQDLSTAVRALLPARVTNLTGSFVNSNGTVAMTPDGVTFGPYADGGAAGGSLIYNGLNGQPLSAVKNLVYYARYLATNNTGGVGAPYLRVFLGNNTHDAIFSPDTQTPDPDTAQGPFHEWVTTSGSWRYDDDGGGTNPDMPFAQLIAGHGSEVISGIRVSTGVSAGVNLQALLRWMQINGKTYVFGS